LLQSLILKAITLTAITIALCIVGALLVELDSGREWVHYLTWFDYHYSHGQWLGELPAGQPWRIITPIFIHYGILHVTFNCILMLQFGGVIERRHGHIRLLILIVIIAAVSNLAQTYATGSQEFGGLSGVVFGLFGYCMSWSRLRPKEGFDLPRSFVTLMLISLVIGYLGFSRLLGLGDTANACHTAGLVSGLVLGALMALLTPRTVSKFSSDDSHH
jgi:GlpG protein